ncbi:MAG: hypothetical protein AMXMBFR4_13250 [Candidatus Hydrogenedentota bacterium]
MGRRLRSIFSFAIILPSIFAIHMALGDAAEQRKDSADLDVFRRLVAEQNKHRERIKSIHLKMNERARFQARDQYGDLSNFDLNIEHEEFSAGERTWVRRSEDRTVEGPKGKTRDTRQTMLAANETSVAYWPVGDGSVYLYNFHTRDEMPRNARTQLSGSNPRNILRFGFGDGSESLGELLEIVESSGRLQVSIAQQKANGSELYIVSIQDSEADESERMTEVLTVDASRGYLITRVVIKEGPFLDREVEVELASTDGVWLPQSWKVSDYKRMDDGTTVLRKQTVNSVSFIEVNPVIAEERFTWRGIEAPEGTRFMVTNSDGSNELLVSDGEILLPNQ